MSKLIMNIIVFTLFVNNAESHDINKILEFALPSVVMINAGETVGSGIIINTDGYIITNFHVIEEMLTVPYLITFKTNTNEKKKVKRIIDYDDDLDLALLQTETLETEIPAIIIHPDSIKLGEEVICIGSPFGLQNYITKGIVSKYTTPYIYTSASINPGNSGGALLNMNGVLIGMPSMSISYSQNLNFAICPRSIRYFLDKNNIKYNKSEEP